MSETLNPTNNEAVVSSETSVQPDTDEELDHIPDFVQPLFDLVTSNGDEVRAWPWMGGTEASLSACIYAHPRAQRYLTPEDIPIMMSEILQTLAQKLETIEEESEQKQEEEPKPPSEEDSITVEEEIAEAEEDSKETGTKGKNEKAQANQNAVDESSQPKKEIGIAAPQYPPVNGAKKVPEAKATPSLAKSGSDQSAQSPVKAEVTNSPANNSVNAPERPGQDPANDNASQELIPIRPAAGDSLIEVAEPEVEAGQQITAVKVLEAGGATSPVEEAIPIQGDPDSVTAHKAEPVTLSVADRVTGESGPPEIQPLDTESAIITDGTVELADEEIEVMDEVPEVATELQGGASSLDDFVDEEILLWEGGLEATAEPLTLEADRELNFSEQVEAIGANPELVVQVGLPIEEVEGSLDQLAERINASEPEVAKQANEKLDKIIEVASSFEAGSGEDAVTGAEVQEELEELFIELFEDMGVDYTPELIESVARLTLKCLLANKVKKLKEEEEDELPQGSGTHEAILQILVGLNTIDDTVDHAYEIGRSALRLCRFSLAIT